jgi:hypothetical protein
MALHYPPMLENCIYKGRLTSHPFFFNIIITTSSQDILNNMLFASTIIKVAAVLAIASQAVFAAPATGRAGGAGSSTQNIQQQALTSHNNYRSRHHVAGLRWSQKLADHATQVSKSCVWGHSVVSNISHFAY